MSEWKIGKNIGILCNNRLLINEQLTNSIGALQRKTQYDSLSEMSTTLVPALKNLQAAIYVYKESPEVQTLVENLVTNILKVDCNAMNSEIKNQFSCLKGEYNKLKEELYSADYDRYMQTVLGRIADFIRALKGPKNLRINGLMSDYNRIVYSSAFRRLQHKAQVFPLEKHDYARTRLTHTMEVASLAANLGNLCAINIFVGKHDNEAKKKNMAFLFEKTCSCAALLHDIGNPPFGHFGEDVIKRYFKDNWDSLCFNYYEGDKCQSKNLRDSFQREKDYKHMKADFERFDGNAQGLRVATKIQAYKPKRSLELTASVLGSLIKYPHSSIADYPKEKFGYFYSERDCIKDLKALGVFQENQRNPLVYLVEAADDISYITSDFDDIVTKKVLSYEVFINELNTAEKEYGPDDRLSAFINNFRIFYTRNQDNESKNPFELTIQRMTNDLRAQLTSEVIDIFTQKLTKVDPEARYDYRFEMAMDKNNNGEFEGLLALTPSKTIVKWIKSLFKKYVYTDRRIISAELTGAKIISSLLDDFVQAVLKLDFHRDKDDKFKFLDDKFDFAKEKRIFMLMSKNFVETFKEETKNIKDVNSLEHIYYRLKLVVDYISGMTDNYAVEIYQTLNGID